jgi:hypothetical protein
VLILDDSNTWPKHISDQLNANDVTRLLQSDKFIDHVSNNPDLIDVFTDVEEYAKSNGLRGFHCTKQLPGYPYTQTGLRVLDIEKHHAEFLKLITNHDSVDERLYRYIDEKLADFRADPNDVESRGKKLWFCLTRNLVEIGTEDFFRYYGGEVIYMPFYAEFTEDDKRVLRILEELGEPVVVEANIAVSDLTVSRQYSFGRALVEHFAQSINRNFFVEGLEGRVTSDVKPTEIVAVHPYEAFKKKWLRRHRGQ